MTAKSEASQHHIQGMKDPLPKKDGDSIKLFVNDPIPPELKEQILEKLRIMEEMEDMEERPLFDYLKETGVSLPKPKTLNDEQLHDKLWEVIRAMAEVNQILYHTDHLSDRQLYEALWDDILREPTYINPEDPNTVTHIDILGGCSEEDIRNRLKYYADEDERESFACEYPDDDIPDHEDPQYDRDRYLPGHEALV